MIREHLAASLSEYCQILDATSDNLNMVVKLRYYARKFGLLLLPKLFKLLQTENTGHRDRQNTNSFELWRDWSSVKRRRLLEF